MCPPMGHAQNEIWNLLPPSAIQKMQTASCIKILVLSTKLHDVVFQQTVIFTLTAPQVSQRYPKFNIIAYQRLHQIVQQYFRHKWSLQRKCSPKPVWQYEQDL